NRTASKPTLVLTLDSHLPVGFPTNDKKNPSCGEFCVPVISYHELWRLLPKVVILLVAVSGASLPIFPQLPRIFKSFTQATLFMKVSSEILHPRENAGKLPH